MGPKRRGAASSCRSPAQKSAKAISKKYRGKKMTPEKAANVRRALYSVPPPPNISAIKARRGRGHDIFTDKEAHDEPQSSASCYTSITLENSVIKGYHVYKIKPPITDPVTKLVVDREYTNIKDKDACLVWIPGLSEFDITLHDMVTDDKRQLKLSDIAALPIGHVPRILASCFYNVLDLGGHVCAIMTGEPTPSFPPWPAPSESGGGVVIPCKYVLTVEDEVNTLQMLRETLKKMPEGYVMKIVVN